MSMCSAKGFQRQKYELVGSFLFLGSTNVPRLSRVSLYLNQLGLQKSSAFVPSHSS